MRRMSRARPRSPEDERKGFHLPAGFEIQLVAAEPYVRKPINIAFDERGRLWVTESVEYPFPAASDKRRATPFAFSRTSREMAWLRK